MFGIDSIEFSGSEASNQYCKVKVGENFESDFVGSLIKGCQMHFDEQQIKLILDPHFKIFA